LSRNARIGLAAALVALLAVVVGIRMATAGGGVETLSIDAYNAKVAAGQVETAEIDAEAGVVTGTYNGTGGEVHYRVEIPPDYAAPLTEKLLAGSKAVKVTAVRSGPSVWDLLVSALPYVMLAGLIGWVLFVLPGGPRLLRKRHDGVRRVHKDRPDVTFRDVAGVDEAVAELAEITDFLADPSRYRRLGARIPRGVLLYGPPGAGKTLLARAVAGEAGVPFFSLSGSDFVEMFAGVGAARVRGLFREARHGGPAIVFIDEIDAVGRVRGSGMSGSGEEREQTLNQLLVEMDGFFREGDLVIMAATNRPDVLDPALLRPGRFDRHVAVDLPDMAGRRRILDIHTRRVPTTAAVDMDGLARRTAGFSGADLANVVNEAALLAARDTRELVRPGDFDEAIERVLTGPVRSRVLSDAERLVTAVHEAGHAVCGHVLPTSHSVHKVSIVGRGQALGFTLAVPDEDRMLMTRTEYLDELTVLLGGRAAEEVVLGEPTNGAADDIERATAKAEQMVCELGMSRRLGPRTFGGRDHAVDRTVSDEMAAEVDREVASIVSEALAAATEIVVERRAVVDRVVTHLLEKESVEGAALVDLLDGNGTGGGPGSVPTGLDVVEPWVPGGDVKR